MSPFVTMAFILAALPFTLYIPCPPRHLCERACRQMLRGASSRRDRRRALDPPHFDRTSLFCKRAPSARRRKTLQHASKLDTGHEFSLIHIVYTASLFLVHIGLATAFPEVATSVHYLIGLHGSCTSARQPSLKELARKQSPNRYERVAGTRCITFKICRELIIYNWSVTSESANRKVA